MDFRERIKVLRSEKRISQAQLAVAFNKSESAIRTWETGRNKPDADTLIQLSQYFECSVDYLLGLSDFKNEEKRKEFESDWDKFFKLLSNRTDYNREQVYEVCIQIINLVESNDNLSFLILDNLSTLISDISLANSILANKFNDYKIEAINNKGEAILTGDMVLHYFFSNLKNDSEKSLSIIWSELYEMFNLLYPNPIDIEKSKEIIQQVFSFDFTPKGRISDPPFPSDDK